MSVSPNLQHLPVPAAPAPALATRRVSTIIPTRDEEAKIARVVQLAMQGEPGEVIVADGGSRDRTREVAAALGARVVETEANRGRQLNAGARAARGDVLLFLHADTVPPAAFCAHALAVLARPGVVAGAFRLRIDAPGLSLRVIERLVALRSRARHMPYGDQALFMPAEVFRRVGGFPELPALEDYELVRRLRRLGRIGIADPPVVTSARRWLEHGVWPTTLQNQLCILAYRLGVPAASLAAWRARGILGRRR